MATQHIRTGDIVHVDFNNAQYTLCHKAIVHHVPCATGDSWVFEDCKTKAIHYVSEGCTVTLLEKGSNHPPEQEVTE